MVLLPSSLIYLHGSGALLKNGLDGPESRYGRYGCSGHSTARSDRNLQFQKFSSLDFLNLLQWILSFFSKLSVDPKCGENRPVSGRRENAQNAVTSLVVMVFSAPSRATFSSLSLFTVGVDEEDGQARERSTIQTLGPVIFRWGGRLPHERVGVKKFGMCMETQGKQTFWWDIAGILLGYSGSAWKV